MSSQLMWYAARSSGIVAWTLAAGSVLWGLVLSTDVMRRRSHPGWVLDLHRFLGGAALTFTGVHVVSILLDGYVHFGLVNVLVPFTGTWHPAAVAWGIVGLYALLAVELTSLARRSLSHRVWRRVHFAGFALFAATTIHALTVGTDRGVTLYTAVVLTTAMVALLMSAVRVARRRSRRRVPAAVVGTR